MIINKLEQDKRDDIISHVEKSIFVEAGAGAGKTTLIVQRITNQIRQGFLKPEELVVITFTNKAAGELYERIQKSFEIEEQSLANTKEQREHFTYAIEHLEQMHISTIHSFCFSLLKERCFEAKIPFDASLLENEENIELQKRFFADWLAKQDKADIEEIKQALVLFKGSSYYYGEQVESVFLKICEKPQDVNFVSCSDTELKQLEADVHTYTTLAQTLLKKLNDEILYIAKTGVDIYEKFTRVAFYPDKEGLKFKSFYKYVEDGFPRKGSGADTYNKCIESLYGVDDIAFCNKGKKPMDVAYAQVNHEFNEWLAANIRPNNVYEKWNVAESKRKELVTSYAYFVMLKYAIKAREEFIQQRTTLTLSNEQLIQKAKDLVWSSQEARMYFADRYKCIYVDEFQDTDHIQADLMWKLACDEQGHLQPGKLFVVGDPKQAIYRFRGGEPAVYNQIKERMIQDDKAEVYELDNNYRSNKEVIQWINGQFKDVINGSGITYRDMVCVAANQPEQTPPVGDDSRVIKGVYHMRTLAGYDSKMGVEKAAYEACMLSMLIKKLVTENYQIYESRKTASGYERVLRPIHYGDFLILCWDTTQMNHYIEAMKEYSIPVDLAGKTDIQGSRVLKSFVALYRYFLQPYDKKSRQGAYHIVFHNGMSEVSAVGEERLNYLRDKTQNMNRYAKAQYLLQHPEYLLPWDEDISKEEIYAIQARLHQMVESVFATAKEEPEYLLQAFENYISNKLERELMLEEDNKAVRFMNLHKAKGLEGNITILTNRKGKIKERIPEYTSSVPNANQQYDYYTCISDNYSSMHGYDYSTDSKAVLVNAKLEDEAEKIRLEYVAATRAKEVLLVTEAYGNNAPFSRYYPPEENNMAKVFIQKQTANTNAATEESVVQGLPAIYKMPTEDMRQAVYVSLSPSGLEGVVYDEASEQTSVTGRVLTEEERKSFPRRPKGNIFGTTMHRSYELFIQQEGDIDSCIHQAIIENAEDLLLEGERVYLLPEEPEEVYLKAVKEFLQIALKKFASDEKMNALLANAKAIYTELPFSYYTSPEEDPALFAAIQKHLVHHKISVGENQPVWVNGTADLVVVDAEGKIRVVDFKSDSKYGESMELFERLLYDKYEGQLLLYKYSMSRIFGVNPECVSTELYHLYRS